MQQASCAPIIINGAKLSTAVVSFRELCSNPRSNLELVRALAKYLYDQLIGPVETKLQADRTLLIELDEGLSGLAEVDWYRAVEEPNKACGVTAEATRYPYAAYPKANWL